MSLIPETKAIDRARGAWGPEIPDWVRVLAGACDASSQSKVARQLGYTAAVISEVIRHQYGAGYDRVADKVRGVLMAETVSCPYGGEIALTVCHRHQDRVAAGDTTHSMIVALRGVCPTCRHWRM